MEFWFWWNSDWQESDVQQKTGSEAIKSLDLLHFPCPEILWLGQQPSTLRLDGTSQNAVCTLHWKNCSGPYMSNLGHLQSRHTLLQSSFTLCKRSCHRTSNLSRILVYISIRKHLPLSVLTQGLNAFRLLGHVSSSTIDLQAMQSRLHGIRVGHARTLRTNNYK